MKKILSIFIFISIISCAQQTKKNSYVDSIKEYRYNINKRFANKENSVLTKEDFKAFKGLDYFPANIKYKVQATFIRTPDEVPFLMPTTTTRKQVAVKYGEALFSLDNEKLVLNIYQTEGLGDEHVNYLFLPFKDETNGESTYEGGRYIELRPPKDSLLVIDFNKAYNPYCAYNDTYSCAIPPPENHLKIAIPAGVKDFKVNK